MEQQDKKISQMSPLQTVSGEEIVPVVKSGGNYSTLVSQIVALARQTMVEAQAGKGLSANDFTDAFKAKLEGLSNYDDAEVRSLITAVNGRLDTILGDGASSAIDTFNEIEAFLTGITDTETLTGLLQQQKQTITSETDTKLSGKVDKVAGKGLSANDYTDADKAKLTALPTKAELDSSLGAKVDKRKWDEEHGQFTVVDKYINIGGRLSTTEYARATEFICLNHKYDIKTDAKSSADTVYVITFYDSTGKRIKGYRTQDLTYGEDGFATLPASEFPEAAAYIRLSQYQAPFNHPYTFTNGPSIESREGAVSEAIQAAITAAVDGALIAEATAAGAVYNRATGYFELNTLTDITAGQMRLILRNPQRPPYNVFVGASIRNRLRTNLWEASAESSADTSVDTPQVFINWSNAEVLNLDNGYKTQFTTRINSYGIFKSCTKLHTILGEFRFVNNKTNAQTFNYCKSLRTFKLREVDYNIDLHWSPNIDFETLQFMVNNALDTNAKTITLHPDAFARLTTELVEAATAKQITFATTN